MDKPLVVVFAADDQYAQPLAVSMASMLLNARRVGVIDIYILNSGMSSANKTQLAALQGLREGARVNFVAVDDDDFKNLPLHTGLHTLATYYRLKLPSLLAEADKVIYLDADIVVECDIRTLWELPMDGLPLLAVEEPRALNGHRISLLGIPTGHAYFNAGVLVMDLAWMRRNKMEGRFAAYIEEHRAHLQYQDQDVLNGCFVGRWKAMPVRFNMEPFMLEGPRLRDFKCYRWWEVLLARWQTGIIHYNQHPKPWVYGCWDPRRGRFWHYVPKTGFKVEQPMARNQAEFIHTWEVRGKFFITEWAPWFEKPLWTGYWLFKKLVKVAIA